MLQDIDALKAKVDSGATRAITQFFLDTQAFYRFVDRVRKAGINIPILPGVMPVTSVKGLKRMAEIACAHIPEPYRQGVRGPGR